MRRSPETGTCEPARVHTDVSAELSRGPGNVGRDLDCLADAVELTGHRSGRVDSTRLWVPRVACTPIRAE